MVINDSLAMIRQFTVIHVLSEQGARRTVNTSSKKKKYMYIFILYYKKKPGLH